MRSIHVRLSFVCLLLTIALPTPASASADDAAPTSSHGPQSGNASFYSHRLTGRRTASGERYDPTGLTAAHRTLPLGTKLRVTNLKNARSVVVTVNDRGRLPRGRVVDVSSAAADALDMKKSGVTRVHTQVESAARTRTAGAPPVDAVGADAAATAAR